MKESGQYDDDEDNEKRKKTVETSRMLFLRV